MNGGVKEKSMGEEIEIPQHGRILHALVRPPTFNGVKPNTKNRSYSILT
jgi:hypothetical protein